MKNLEKLVIPQKIFNELIAANQKRNYNVEMNRVLEKYEGRKYHNFLVGCRDTLILLRKIRKYN